jgi:hypothetical protein
MAIVTCEADDSGGDLKFAFALLGQEAGDRDVVARDVGESVGEQAGDFCGGRGSSLARSKRPGCCPPLASPNRHSPF